jgi:DNA segregation ATPase FtsK/SpoIIIE, S-DNA-T family
MVHGQPVNAGYDTAGDDGHASAGHASACNDGACGDGAGSGRGAELVRRPSAVPARHRRDGGVARPPVGRRVVVATARVVGRVARHEPSLNGARWLLRNGVLYIATGAWVLARRGWEARTNARYERLLRAAEAAGDYERLTDWEQRAEQARERRHRRRLAWITAPLDVARTAAVMTLVGVGFLLLLGGMLAVAHRDPAWLLTPLQKVVDGIAWAVWLLDLVWLPVTVVLPWLLLAGLWQLGRRHGQVPRWAAPGGVREHPTVIVTPGGVAAALAHLGIPAMNRAVKDGWQVEFATPPVRVNGRGYQTTFSLPMGVTPEMVADKRDVLARNLVRAPLEVWPSAAERAGYVDLWVADQGSTERPAPNTRCCTRAPPTCSPGSRSGCRSAAR